MHCGLRLAGPFFDWSCQWFLMWSHVAGSWLGLRSVGMLGCVGLLLAMQFWGCSPPRGFLLCLDLHDFHVASSMVARPLTWWLRASESTEVEEVRACWRLRSWTVRASLLPRFVVSSKGQAWSTLKGVNVWGMFTGGCTTAHAHSSGLLFPFAMPCDQMALSWVLITLHLGCF